MTAAIDLVFSVYVVGRLAGRWAVHWCGCRSERHGAEGGQKEMSEHVCLLLATGRRGEMRSD